MKPSKFVISMLFTISIIGWGVFAYEIDTYEFLMPNVWPNRDELYLCTPIRIAPQKNFYVVGFKPNASMHTAHHMLLYGCSEPGSNDSVWSCGEMQSNEIDDRYNTASPCKSGSQIVYAWARDAPRLQLPPDVGFLIGRDSPIKYFVLQVHYMMKFPEGKTDNSGVFLEYTTERMPRQAGVILLGTSGVIPANKVEHMETACTVNEEKVIHPFAFRPHTHALGTEVSGFVVRHSPKGDMWQLLGSQNPQRPQMFYPVASSTPITQGDVLAARCVMNNTNMYPVQIGRIWRIFETPLETMPLKSGTYIIGINLCHPKNPQRPQIPGGEFHITQGDVQAARCVMNNTNVYPVQIGATNKDEMCNFYLMYWVQDDTPLAQKYCFSPGPPYYYWSRDAELRPYNG